MPEPCCWTCCPFELPPNDTGQKKHHITSTPATAVVCCYSYCAPCVMFGWNVNMMCADKTVNTIRPNDGGCKTYMPWVCCCWYGALAGVAGSASATSLAAITSMGLLGSTHFAARKCIRRRYNIKGRCCKNPVEKQCVPCCECVTDEHLLNDMCCTFCCPVCGVADDFIALNNQEPSPSDGYQPLSAAPQTTNSLPPSTTNSTTDILTNKDIQSIIKMPPNITPRTMNT